MAYELGITLVRGNVTIGSGSGAIPLGNAIPTSVGITLRADPNNSGVVYVGGSDVSSGSYPLKAGDTLEIKIKDGSSVYVIGSGSGQIVHYIGTV